MNSMNWSLRRKYDAFFPLLPYISLKLSYVCLSAISLPCWKYSAQRYKWSYNCMVKVTQRKYISCLVSPLPFIIQVKTKAVPPPLTYIQTSYTGSSLHFNKQLHFSSFPSFVDNRKAITKILNSKIVERKKNINFVILHLFQS